MKIENLQNNNIKQLYKDEYWKQIKGFPNYYISNYGRIWSIHKKDFKKPRKNKYGYFIVDLYNKNIGKTFIVHRLVAEHFIPNPENKSEVNHIDGNKQNNYAGNLEWVTPKENIQHAITNNLMNNKGENNKQSILTEKDVKEIIYLLKYTSLTQKEIAEKYNVASQTISQIKLQKTWKYLNLDIKKIKNKTAKGERNGRCKITEEIAKSIIYDLLDKQLKSTEIAKKYNVTYDTVQNIKHKKSWKYLYDKLEGDYLDGSKDIINY